MRKIEYSKDELLGNLRRNRKKTLIVFCIFLLMSLAMACIFGLFYPRQENEAAAVSISRIDKERYRYDETYFYSLYTDLKKGMDALNAYAEYLEQVELGEDSRERLSLFQNLLGEKKKLFDDVKGYYVDNGPIVIDDREAALKFVNKYLETYKSNVKSAEKEVEMLSEPFSTAFIKSTESSLYKQIKRNLREIPVWELQKKNIAEKDDSQMEEINSAMDTLLEDGVDGYNILAAEFEQMISGFEDEQYDIIFNEELLESYSLMAGIEGEFEAEDILSDKKNDALIYARSIAGLDSRQERFFAFLTFGIFMSCGLSFLYGLLRRKDVNE